MTRQPCRRPSFGQTNKLTQGNDKAAISKIVILIFFSSHKDFVVRSIMLDGENSMLKRYLECRFCGQHFMRRHAKLFTIHVEQKHESELQQYLHREATKFTPSGNYWTKFVIFRKLKCKCNLVQFVNVVVFFI